jgi:hypothetical protein
VEIMLSDTYAKKRAAGVDEGEIGGVAQRLLRNQERTW